MGIAHLKNAPYTKVSGGERQLAYIARAGSGRESDLYGRAYKRAGLRQSN